MRILIISDLHANAEALEALPRDYDELWVLGDLVNYGPSPVEVIEFVRAHASLVVRGNHDHAIAFDEDPRCSERFRSMAEATARFTRAMLLEEHKRFLRELPRQIDRTVDGVTFVLCHAVPSNPLHEYCPPDSNRWLEEAGAIQADVLLTGHTHLPFQRKLGSTLIVNPGSVGQPKHGCPETRYAVWDAGSIRLCGAAYAVEETIRKLESLPLAAPIRADLAHVLRNGGA